MSDVDISAENVEYLARSLAFVANRTGMTVERCEVVTDSAAATLRALRAALDAAEDKAADACSTLQAWFDLAKKAESAGTEVLKDSIGTWLRRASNGGMPDEHADIVRNVVDEAARLYLWKALVPVLRTMQDEQRDAAQAALLAAQARADAAEHALNMERARVHECRTIQREMAHDIQTLQPPAALLAAWRQGVEAAADAARSTKRKYLINAAEAEMRERIIDVIMALQPPADLAAQAAQAPGDAVALRDALTLAANRLHRLQVDQVPNSKKWFEISEWVEEARASARAGA